MQKDKPRLARLTAILTQLQSKKMVTARELAEKYHISIRTVYRDIRTLESSGIPVVTEEGKGYSLLEGYRLPPVSFSEEEAFALITAEQIIANNADTSLVQQFQNAITKVKAVMRSQQQEKTAVLADKLQIRKNDSLRKPSNLLMQLQEAVVTYKVVNITYLSLEKERTERLVEPFAVFSTNENWVLIAFCQLRNAFRYFRLDCIEKLQPTNKLFEPHNMTLQEYFEICKATQQKV